MEIVSTTQESGREPEYLTARQLAEKLNVSLKVVCKWTQTKRLPYVKMGRMNRYPLVEIEKRLISGRLLSDKRQT